MPTISDAPQNLKKFYLPSTAFKRAADGALLLDDDKKPIPTPEDEQIYVTLDMRPLTVMDTLNTYLDTDNENARLAKLVFNRISAWNITEADGTPRPITFDNFCRLPALDFNYLKLQDLGPAPRALSADQKKS